MRLVGTIVAALALAGCASPPISVVAVEPSITVSDELIELAAKRTQIANDTYRAQIGDEVHVTVFDAEDLNSNSRVTPAGTINVPLVGGVSVEGMTELEIRDELERLYGARYLIDPNITVFLARARLPSCRILGAVARPGTYEIHPGSTLLDLISLAGGIRTATAPVAYLLPAESKQALMSMIQAPRTDPSGLPDVASAPPDQDYTPSSIPVPLRQLIEEGDPRVNVALRDGDTLTVVSAHTVYVTGAVSKPGALSLGESLTLTQALALAGGATGGALLPDTRIMRKEQDGTTTRIVADVRAILESQASDIKLQPEDVIFVPSSALHSAYKEIFRYLAVVAMFGLRLF